jgi:peroxiredoxin
MIKAGDKLPEGTVKEYIEVETPGCPVGPKEWKVEEIVKGKKIVIFGLPGAFTPTCSAKHVPGYLENFGALKGKGVDEIWCLSVNDAFVMGAWGRDQKAIGKIRFMGDGAGDYTKKLGMDREIPGMGLRSQRYSLLVEDGVVKSVNLEAAGKFEVSDAQSMLKALG